MCRSEFPVIRVVPALSHILINLTPLELGNSDQHLIESPVIPLEGPVKMNAVLLGKIMEVVIFGRIYRDRSCYNEHIAILQSFEVIYLIVMKVAFIRTTEILIIVSGIETVETSESAYPDKALAILSNDIDILV